MSTDENEIVSAPGLTRARARELLKELTIINLVDLLMAKATMDGQRCKVNITTPRVKKVKP